MYTGVDNSWKYVAAPGSTGSQVGVRVPVLRIRDILGWISDPNPDISVSDLQDDKKSFLLIIITVPTF